MQSSYKLLSQLIVLTFLIVAFDAAPLSARPSSGTIQVRVRIYEPTRVEGVASLDFGRLTLNSSEKGETSYRLAPDGTLTVQSENGGTHIGGHEVGRFSFSGSAGQSYSYEAGISRDFSDPGLKLAAVHVGTVGASKGTGSFGSAGDEISVGGDLLVTGAPPAGEHGDAEITLTVSYD